MSDDARLRQLVLALCDAIDSPRTRALLIGAVASIDDPRVRTFLVETRRALLILADAVKALLGTPPKK